MRQTFTLITLVLLIAGCASQKEDVVSKTETTLTPQKIPATVEVAYDEVRFDFFDLEKYLGQPVPEGARLTKEGAASYAIPIQLVHNNGLSLEIILSVERNIVVAARYKYTYLIHDSELDSSASEEFLFDIWNRWYKVLGNFMDDETIEFYRELGYGFYAANIPIKSNVSNKPITAYLYSVISSRWAGKPDTLYFDIGVCALLPD